MARNGQRIEFANFGEMATHLDRWAANDLVDAAGWTDALLMSRAWLDYSARNQLLLASYGADGPVAGPETWRLVPSTSEGRGCAVRAGEHGYPVRVPVTTAAAEPDPYLGGHRPTRAAVERWEWRPVFSVAQLARRPAPDSLIAVEVPDHLRGQGADGDLLAAARKVTAATVRGRLPRTDDPMRLLTDAAIRLRRSSKRPALDADLAAEVAWLVTDRVGLACGDVPPSFDPSSLKPRERWERLQDVLEPARKLTAALGVAVGVDLVGSPLPRMDIVDDRVVPAGRRHRLPAASLEQLPVGRWVAVGPYSAAEWAARGEHAVGAGAFLRLNKTAYLAAVETGDGAAWRLEDVASRTGHGLLATGTADNLDDARADAVATVRHRYPALTPTRADTGRLPQGVAGGWEQMPGAGNAAAQFRHLNDHVTLYVMPGPGGRWLPAIHTTTTGVLERLPLQRTSEDARDVAEKAGHRIARAADVADPVRADNALASFADSGSYSRRELTALVRHRLEPDVAARLDDATPAELIELLGAAGFTAATTVAVLAAEGIDGDVAGQLLPIAGVPMADGIRVLHERWDLPRTSAAQLLAATATEMRDAGCTASEIMACRPRDVLRTLPAEPHLWELAAGTMAVAEHPTSVIAQHLVAHAPTPEAFAAGLAVIGEPTDALTAAARAGAHPDQLAAASEMFGLNPHDTATTLVDVTTAEVALDTLAIRCDGDTTAAIGLAVQAGMTEADIDAWRHPATPGPATMLRSSLDLDSAALLATLPPAGPVFETDPIHLLASLTPGLEPTSLEPTP